MCVYARPTNFSTILSFETINKLHTIYGRFEDIRFNKTSTFEKPRKF